jgi:hypothetical protein
MYLQVCALFERVINAEGSDVDLDQVAAAAMEAVEGAVRDEVEAATVLSATQAALAKTLQDLQALDGESAAARVAEISSVLASTDTPAAAAASVDGSSSKAPSPTADAIQLLDSLTTAGAGAAGGAAGSAAAAGAALLQAVDAPSSNGSGGQAAAAAAAPVAMASYDSTSKAAEQAKKSQVEKAKAKLMKLGGAAVAIGLAYAFLQTAAGQVRRMRRCLFLECTASFTSAAGLLFSAAVLASMLCSRHPDCALAHLPSTANIINDPFLCNCRRCLLPAVPCSRW